MRALIIITLLSTILVEQSASSETTVTTYVTTVQEERKSTRFTLTEWLRIKERMKLMDVWLAMFSDPKKDTFRPELSLVYFKTKGDLNYKATNQSENDDGDINGSMAKAQLYLTNIFTGSTGIRTLNIDFGLEGGLKNTTDYEPDTSVNFANSRKLTRTHWSSNFRIFGKNIQDSSMILKVGQYQARDTRVQLTGENERTMRKGLLVGGELQLYLFRWLGLEGNYLDFQPSSNDNQGWSTSGQYYDYMAYVEVSLFRLMFGAYSDEWKFKNGSEQTSTKETGLLGGVKLQL